MSQKTPSQGFVHLGLIIVTVLVVVAAGFAGWYVWYRNQDEKQSNSTDNTSQPNGSQQPEEEQREGSTVVAPEGWRQYKNDTAGFSFYYPPEWGDVKSGGTKYQFSKLSGASFQANRRDKQHDPVEFGIRDNNIIDVSVNRDSAVVTYLSGTEPPTKEKVIPSSDVVRRLPNSLACVAEVVNPNEFGGDPDAANTRVYLGYCGLVNPVYGAFTFNSNGRDTTKPESQKLKEDIVKLLQTFETF